MHHPASAADARASLQKTLLHVCKVAAQEESAVICAALAAVKETILATSAALVVAAKECQVEYSSLLTKFNPEKDLVPALDLIMFKEAAVAEAATLLALSSFSFGDASAPCLLHSYGLAAVDDKDGISVKSIGSYPPAMIIMRCRPNFAPLPSILELCEALALAAVQCAGFGTWSAAEAMAMSCIAWAWAVQGQDLIPDMRTAFDSLLQSMLVTMCQCNLQRLASSAPFVAWSKEACAAAARGDSAQLKLSHQEFASHALHAQASDCYLLHAALAIQARLYLTGDTSETYGGHVSLSTLAAAAMLKTFEVVAAAPLTHPLPQDWDLSGLHDNFSDAEPLSTFVAALLSNSSTSRPLALHRAASARCGRPDDSAAHTGSAWWCSSPYLMQGDREAVLSSIPPLRSSSSLSSAHALPSSSPHHRYMSRNSQPPRFVWPSHHYSAVLEGWACFRTRQSNVEKPMFRSCPLHSLGLGIQPILHLFSSHTAREIQGHTSSATGLLPYTAFLIESAHQPLCVALKLVLTPIISIETAIPFVNALRQQSAEAASALLASQRAHMSLLGTSVGFNLLERQLEAESSALEDYIALGIEIDRSFENLLLQMQSNEGGPRISASVQPVGSSSDLWRLVSVMHAVAVAGHIEEKLREPLSDSSSAKAASSSWELGPRDLNQDVGIFHHAILRLSIAENYNRCHERASLDNHSKTASSDIGSAMKQLFSSVCRRLVSGSPQLKTDIKLLQTCLRLRA